MRPTCTGACSSCLPHAKRLPCSATWAGVNTGESIAGVLHVHWRLLHFFRQFLRLCVASVVNRKAELTEYGATPATPLTVLALAAGKWTAYYAASCLDGSAVAVQHWAGEVER